MNTRMWTIASLLTLTVTTPALSQDFGDRIDRHLDRKGDRIDRHLDRKGNRIDHRLDMKGDRIEQRLDEKGAQINDRLDQKAEHAAAAGQIGRASCRERV